MWNFICKTGPMLKENVLAVKMKCKYPKIHKFGSVVDNIQKVHENRFRC